jgi:hypothetical protein
MAEFHTTGDNYENKSHLNYKGYTRPTVTRQDEISRDPALIAEKLNGFIKIFPQHYDELHGGVWIKYLNEENKYRSGGVLKVNRAPEYFILRSPYTKKSWSVSLAGKTIYMRGEDGRLDKMVEKNNLYKLYEAGLVTISEAATPDEIQAVLES